MSIKKTSLIAIAVIGIIAFGAFASIATAWPPNGPPYDHCHALIVGISDFEGTEDDMDDSSVRDATELYWHLNTQWPQDMGNIRLRTDRRATKNTIDSDFNTLFAGMDSDDLAIVYWAGHGGWTGFDDAPVDENGGQDGALRTYHTNWGYSDDEFAEKINAITAGTKVVILDSCHMGEFESELDMSNTVVILSTRTAETTDTYVFSDPIPTNHKPFSYYFNRAGDTNGDGVITIEEAFAYANPRTVANAAANGNSQHPILIDNVPGGVAYLDSWG